MDSEKKEADYYFNEQGLMVFTEHYHRKRGYCCGSGCRHCPFDYVNVKGHISKKSGKQESQEK